ncbi:predicted protein [Verticillium alfalfae VaMs.102]|uniref:Predicted protein n=1 Tax=Verticillium alfalfae (strain VaMs.102 / ATCC MYA-4576 / FGSC 10136) TaxID=526221 RepID=C9SNQ3_VERA1|nr:predicted protein [Verticillium alfalfae VaMs.102]EEY20418.1 predicted protein [Verticillium alfalfae VaMs.102]
MAADPNRAVPDLERGSSRQYSREKARPTSSSRRKATHSHLCFCVPIQIDARVQKYAHRRGFWAFLCWLFWICLSAFACRPPSSCCANPPSAPVHVRSRSGSTLSPQAFPSMSSTMPPRSARSVRSSRSRSSEIGSPLSTRLSSIPERHESPARVVRKPLVAGPGVERPAVVVAPAVISPEHHAPDPGMVKRSEKGQVHDIEDDRISAT